MSESIILEVHPLSKLYINERCNKNAGVEEIAVTIVDESRALNCEIGILDLICGHLLFTRNDDTLYSGVPHDALRVLADYIKDNLEE